MPTARRIRRGAAGSSPPAPGSRSGSDQDFYDAVENSGDMAAEDVASVDENEQAVVDLAPILEGATKSRGVAEDGSWGDADDEDGDGDEDEEDAADKSDDDDEDNEVVVGGDDSGRHDGKVCTSFDPVR